MSIIASESVDPSLVFLLNSGKQFDVAILAHRTANALQIITPWYQIINVSRSIICKEMQFQALVYGKAIYFSVEAAHQGLAVCENALALVECIQNTSAEERRKFLEGVKEIAKKGFTNSKEARDRFFHVRGTVETLLASMKTEDQEAMIEYDSGFHFIQVPFAELMAQLTKGIQGLEEFSNILTRFASWWNELVNAIEMNIQLSREDGMAKQRFDAFLLQNVEIKWKDHRSSYETYVNEINIDSYPKLSFAESKLLTFLEAPQPGTVGSSISPANPDNIPSSTSLDSPLNQNNNDPNTPRDEGPMRPERPLPESREFGFHLPGFFHGPPQILPFDNAILSEKFSATSSMSATLASVQMLKNNMCFVMLRFQCHPSQHHRFTLLRIKWRLKEVGGNYPGRMIDIAPKLAMDVRNREGHRRVLGVKVPARFSPPTHSQPDANSEMNEMNAKLGYYAIFITGSLCGHQLDAAEWTIEENTRAMTGIPPHFCVAAIIHHEGPSLLTMELDVLAEQLGTTGVLRSSNRAKAGVSFDANQASKGFPPCKPSDEWRTWFPRFFGAEPTLPFLWKEQGPEPVKSPYLQTASKRRKVQRSFYGSSISQISNFQDRDHIDDDDSYAPSIATRYSKAASSVVTDYGFYYIRRALNSSSVGQFSWSQHSSHDGTFT